ncbi:riboflavin kinase [Microthyrium microscopicum]|uniref:Riboflavin kinase n=1 Tax=Microthyrium microscopicum TaxID=703497 RepID=A0A6A6UGY3_9PEZI|nr:riboflavin kinase [Microthyrium microscopicum]
MAPKPPTGARELYAGPESGPEKPFPVKVNGPIVKGFGRGSKELGIPTANIPLSGLEIGGHEDLDSGIYYGWAGLNLDDTNNKGTIYPMVMSIGWNPFYGNKVRSLEVHIMHKFGRDFYGHHLNLIILGFIRPEYDYVSKESLIEDIETDIQVTARSLERTAYVKWKNDEYLKTFPEGGEVPAEPSDAVAST